MSATDIEIELNEIETSDSTLKTASLESQEISHANVRKYFIQLNQLKQNESSRSLEQKEEIKPPINSDSSLGIGLKKYDIDKYYRGQKDAFLLFQVSQLANHQSITLLEQLVSTFAAHGLSTVPKRRTSLSTGIRTALPF